MKNYKKLKKLILAIEDKNIMQIKLDDLEYRKGISDRFKTSTAAEKRVMIAEDFLAQYKLGKLLPSTGNWVESANHDDFSRCQSLQESLAIENIYDTCQVCEVGGVFMSIVRLNGDFDISKNDFDTDDKKFIEKLKKFYSVEQLSLMEMAYEGGGGFVHIKQMGRSWDNNLKTKRQTL